MSFEKNRRMDLTIYFTGSPTPIQIKNVCHMGTEGGLLRIITDGGYEAGGQTQWWPLQQVFNIRLDDRRLINKEE